MTLPTLSRAVAVAAAAGIALALLASPGAHAATTCTHSTPGLLEVHTSAPADAAFVRTVGGAIKVSGIPGSVTCAGAPATTTSIDTILIVDDSDNPATPAIKDGSTYVGIDEPASFGPGKTPEADGVSEIEFQAYPKSGNDVLALGGQAKQVLVAGNDGVAWSNDGDADVVGMPFPSLVLSGGSQEDYLSGRGGHGTGAALSTSALGLNGGEGDDDLFGGDAPGGDNLSGDAGDDAMIGYDGADSLAPGAGDDTLQGGAGVDAVDFADTPNGVRVDLRNVLAQATGEGLDSIVGIEDVVGSEYADTLLGDDGPNLFDANDGDDMLEGRGGADEFRGDDGSDTVSYAGAPAGVTVDLSKVVQPGEGDRLDSIEGLMGSPFADTLSGGPGANRIDGGAGADVVAAGAGTDTVRVRDGEGDRVSCGDGADTASADRRTLDALDVDCETVDALPEPAAGDGGQGPLPTDAADTELDFSLSAARAQRVLRQRGIRMRLSCPDEPCTVTASASALLRRGGDPALVRRRPLTVEVATPGARQVRLALSRRSRRALRAAIEAGGRPSFRVTATARDAAGNSVTRVQRVRSAR